MATDLPGMFSTDEVAAELGVTPAMVRKYIRDGRLEAGLVGERTYIVSRKQLDAFKRVPRRVGNPTFRKS